MGYVVGRYNGAAFWAAIPMGAAVGASITTLAQGKLRYSVLAGLVGAAAFPWLPSLTGRVQSPGWATAFVFIPSVISVMFAVDKVLKPFYAHSPRLEPLALIGTLTLLLVGLLPIADDRDGIIFNRHLAFSKAKPEEMQALVRANAPHGWMERVYNNLNIGGEEAAAIIIAFGYDYNYAITFLKKFITRQIIVFLDLKDQTKNSIRDLIYRIGVYDQAVYQILHVAQHDPSMQQAILEIFPLRERYDYLPLPCLHLEVMDHLLKNDPSEWDLVFCAANRQIPDELWNSADFHTLLSIAQSQRLLDVILGKLPEPILNKFLDFLIKKRFDSEQVHRTLLEVRSPILAQQFSEKAAKGVDESKKLILELTDRAKIPQADEYTAPEKFKSQDDVLRFLFSFILTDPFQIPPISKEVQQAVAERPAFYGRLLGKWRRVSPRLEQNLLLPLLRSFHLPDEKNRTAFGNAFKRQSFFDFYLKKFEGPSKKRLDALVRHVFDEPSINQVCYGDRFVRILASNLIYESDLYDKPKGEETALTGPFASLPRDFLLHLLYYLPPKALAMMGRTGRTFHNYIFTGAKYWQAQGVGSLDAVRNMFKLKKWLDDPENSHYLRGKPNPRIPEDQIKARYIRMRKAFELACPKNLFPPTEERLVYENPTRNPQDLIFGLPYRSISIFCQNVRNGTISHEDARLLLPIIKRDFPYVDLEPLLPEGLR